MQYGLLGKKLSHSFSPQIHSLLGLPEYGLIEVAENDLQAFMTRKDFSAINVTIPYKQDVMPYCDYLSEDARSIGAVNTIVNRDGKLSGYNTDFSGLLFMAKRVGIDFAGKTVLILGSGGTSKTAAFAATSSGASAVHIVSRNGELNYDNVHQRCPDADIIINTTPIGMYPKPDAVPIDLSKFNKLSGVLDAIYNPMTTRLIAEAKSLGIPASNGLAMLVTQAVFAEEKFFDKQFPDSICEKILKQIDSKMRNIVLCGMPSCGKSTVGQKLAEIMLREFIDIDAEIVDKAGMSIPEIFEKYGEGHFRDIESAVVAEQCAKNSAIISLGGGSVLREENRKAISQNAFVVYLIRPTEDLITDGRPLSRDTETLQKMYELRHPIYSDVADFVCENSEGKMRIATEISRKFFERSV